MIAPKFHFVWFQSDEPGKSKPFSYVHYLCLLSVIKAHPEGSFAIYVNQPIESPWWEAIRSHFRVEMVEPPTEIYGVPIQYIEHQSDVFRLRTLIREGGVYLDLDVFFKRSLEPLFGNKMVMGIEERTGFCNAVMLAEPQSPFLIEWLASYDPASTREGAGFDPEKWSDMSVKFPSLLARDFEDYITVMPRDAFFYPIGTDTDMEILFNSPDYESPQSYCHHLWQSQAWDDYLHDLDPEKVLSRPGYFYRTVRETLTTAEIEGTVNAPLV